MSVPAMRPFLPKRLEPVAFGFLLLGMMSLIVSGMATVLAVGIHSGFVFQSLTAWAPSWAIAFPAVLVVAPVVRRILKRIVQDP